MYMATGTLTTIPVHAEVLRRLRTLKTADQTWDTFLLEMAEDYTPPGWYAELERRRVQGADIEGREVIRKSRAMARHGK